MRARYYDSSTGRFISRDPFEGDPLRPISQNAYHFAANNPINYSDLLGLDYVNSGWNISWGGIVVSGGALTEMDLIDTNHVIRGKKL
jgi:uncharacterized protein RhaS with RHS repeats